MIYNDLLFTAIRLLRIHERHPSFYILFQLESLSVKNGKVLRDELARQGLAKNAHAQDMLDMQYRQLAAEDEKAANAHIEAEKKALVESCTDSLMRVERLLRHAQGW